MRRLDGFSAFMVYNDVPCCYQHTLKIAIIEWDNPADYSFNFFLEHFEEGTTIFPMLRWKLQQVPLGINHPVWVHDTNFSLSHHVKRIACPKPGDKRTFCELVSELYAQPLDKSLPLWQVWIIEGLENDQVAMVCMFHHAYTDGAGAARLFQGLFNPKKCKTLKSIDFGVDPNDKPTRPKIFLKAIVDLPIMFFSTFPRLIVALTKFYRLRRQYISTGKPLPPVAKEAPDSPLNTTYTQRRTFAYEDFSLEDFRTISKYFGVTINDLLVAVVAGGVRRYYQEKQYPLDHALVAGIPVNMRNEEQKKAIIGNYVANSFMRLPINVGDPVERLEIAALSGKIMKDYIAATGTPWLFLAMELVAPSVVDFLNWILHRSKGQLKLFGNIVISNVVGPREPMRFYGGKVVNWLSIGQLFAGLGVNVTCWSYADKFSMCLMAEKQVIQNGERFLKLMRESFEEYQQIYQSRQGDWPYVQAVKS